MRPNTLAAAIERIQAGEPQDVALAEFVDTFLMAPDGDARYATLEQEPARCDDERLNALAGAMAEYLAKQYRLHRVPKWVSEPWRHLDQPWFTTSSSSPAMQEYLAFTSPAEFRSRNIFTEERPLRRARSHIPPEAENARRTKGMIIAIDGPAASGKGTLGKRLAAHYGVRHLDTGLIYRAVAKALLDSGQALDDRDAAVAAARALDPARFDEQALKGHQIGDAASIVSAIPEVRAALVAFQRDFAARPPGAVLDGRDIGTVICPDADAKIFVIAAPQERARRRALELKASGQSVDEAAILTDILRRDERDRSRATAPLKPAADAHELDTTHLDVEQAVAAAIRLIEGVRARPR